jgi:hypothetical protein
MKDVGQVRNTLIFQFFQLLQAKLPTRSCAACRGLQARVKLKSRAPGHWAEGTITRMITMGVLLHPKVLRWAQAVYSRLPPQGNCVNQFTPGTLMKGCCRESLR